MYPDALIGNCLQHQKDRLRDLIFSQSEEPDKLAQLLDAITILSFVKELWCATDYAYKGRELCDFILDDLRKRLADLHHAASKQRAELEHWLTFTQRMRDAYSKAENQPKRDFLGMTDAELCA
jgi:hypothetical protein